MIQLDFELEKQKDSRLCWAAVSISIAQFYRQKGIKTQIEFAKSIFGEKYNQFCSPHKALSSYDNLLESLQQTMTLKEIIEDLKKQQPVVACMKDFVGWHLVVIYGVDRDEKLLVADPLRGCSKWEINKFIAEYCERYSWVYTYRIKKSIK